MPSLLHVLTPYADWSGGAADLVSVVPGLCERAGLPDEVAALVPSERRVRDWRVKGIFTHAKGARFGARQLLECLAAMALKAAGWRLDLVAKLVADGSDADLHKSIDDALGDSAPLPVGAPARQHQDASMAVALLAQGLLQLYDRVQAGQAVRQDDRTIPPTLQSAMCHLGRLYLLAGGVDEAACVHDLLDRARRPLHTWGLDALESPGFDLRESVLIDPELRIPTADCQEIAEQSGGVGEQHLLEERCHRELVTASERCGAARKAEVYSLLRGFVVRHPLVRHAELLEFCHQHALRPALRSLREFYTHAPRTWQIDGAVWRCRRCGTMLQPAAPWRGDRFRPCVLRQCREKGPAGAPAQEPYVDGEWLLAVDPIQVYWVGPGLDELELFDAAVQAGRDAELYPRSDACDVGVDGLALGIDAKSYTSPFALGSRLRRKGVGGLMSYQRRILAIGDELLQATPNYLGRVRAAMGSSLIKTGVEVMSVSDAVAVIEGG